jgi:acetoin utilization deacetylase AcuC-like enzyme
MVTAARLLAEARVQRIAIVDCDYHYGNGTQDIIDAQAWGDRVLHVSFGRTFRRPEQADEYLAAVADLRGRFQEFVPQLILYQAGADPHVDDPFGGLLTTEQLRARDRTLLSIARELVIPLTWNLAGGYQIESDGSIPRVVELHLNTFEEALRVWQLL